MMTAMTYDSKPKLAGYNLIILACVIAIVFGVYIPLNRHSFEAHGMHAVEAVRCYNERGATFTMIDPKTNRKAIVCNDPSKEYGWYIIIVCAITTACISAYKRERAKSRYQVRDYLKGSGWKDCPND